MGAASSLNPQLESLPLPLSLRIPSESLSSTPPIFHLTVDCCDEIFDYLSLKELHSFGITCKAFRKVAGEYFLRNYAAASKVCCKDGIYTISSGYNGVKEYQIHTSGFNEHMTNISLSKQNADALHYLKAHSSEFTSLNRLVIHSQPKMSADDLIYLRELFPKLEILCINNSYIECNYYENILKYCENLKRLLLYVAYELYLPGRDSWLHQNYPKLEHLEWIPIRSVDTLSTFLAHNPNVRSLTIVTRCIWRYRAELLKSNIKLDLLAVRNVYGEAEPTLEALCDLLYQLHERRIYKRLNLYVYTVDENTSVKLLSLQGLERLCVWKFTKCYSLPQLVKLKELTILEDANPNDMEILATNFLHLQRFLIKNATFEVILPFFRRSPNLIKVKIYPSEDAHLDKDMLIKLNEERMKLFEARKVTIYVPDYLFLKMKWNTKHGDTDLQMIEMKRYSTVWEWDN